MLVKLSVMIDWLVFNANISSISFCYVWTGKFVWDKHNSLFTILFNVVGSFCYVRTGKFVWDKHNSLFTILFNVVGITELYGPQSIPHVAHHILFITHLDQRSICDNFITFCQLLSVPFSSWFVYRYFILFLNSVWLIGQFCFLIHVAEISDLRNT